MAFQWFPPGRCTKERKRPQHISMNDVQKMTQTKVMLKKSEKIVIYGK